MTKKFLIFIAMLAVAAILWAENQTISCESKYGTCSLERSEEKIFHNCVCSNGNGSDFYDPVIEGFNDGPLTEKWCQSTIDDYCKKIPAQCYNEAGACELDKNGNYKCHCHYIEGEKTGSGYFGEEECNEILVELCGTETPTLRKVCAEEILNECASYLERIKNNCSKEPVNDINDILDLPINGGSGSVELGITLLDFADCCRSEYWRNEYKKQSDCLETYETCENQECCVCTAMMLGDGSSETADTGDSGPADSATDSGDTENSEAPADGAAAPAEKEESKSGGCSMLFV